MNINHKYIDDMTDIIEDALTITDEPRRYSMEKDQPKHFSWFHVWWSVGGIASDFTTALEYSDAEDFQQALVDKVRLAFNTSSLQLIRDGKITNFGMQIGPHTPDHLDINEELGLEVNNG